MISPTGAGTTIKGPSGRRVAAFTLIEILLVVVLLTVITGLAAPNFSTTLGRIQLEQTAEHMVYLMRYAQSRAVLDRRVYQFRFDAAQAVYRLGRIEDGDTQTAVPLEGRLGRTFRLPDGVESSPDEDAITFYPDGTADEIRLVLRRDDHVYTISTADQKGYVHLFPFAVP